MKRVVPLLFLLIWPITVLFSQTNFPKAPELYAKSAILLDAATGEVLFEKEADAVIPPASLTKLVTLHVIYSMMERGLLEGGKPVAIPESAWAVNMPARSSLMFLGPGQNVTLEELMKGVAVSSGNDAALALAEIAAGSVDEFAEIMNKEVHALGFQNMYFVEPSGLSELNRITARDFARFCRRYIELHPKSLEELHSVRSFTYPAPENLQEGIFARSFTQKNRNSLLWQLDDVDGLKTGYIEESGYNIAATGRTNGMRLIAVVLGIEADNHAEGGRKRSEDAKKLLLYGFEFFETLKPRNLVFPRVKVWKGKKERFAIQPAEPVVLTILKASRETLQTEVKLTPNIEAPVNKGDIVGELLVYTEGEIYKRFPFAAVENVERGNIFRVVYDSIVLFFRSL